MSTCSSHDPVSDLVASLLPEEIRGRHENKRNTSTTTAHSKVAEHIYLVATFMLASVHIHTPGQVRWSRSCTSNSIFAWHNVVCVGDQQQRLLNALHTEELEQPESRNYCISHIALDKLEPLVCATNGVLAWTKDYRSTQQFLLTAVCFSSILLSVAPVLYM